MPETPREELARRVAELPKEAQTFFTNGFIVASKLTADARDRVLRGVIESLGGGSRRLDGSILRSLTNLSERESEQLASVYSLVIGLLSESAASTDDFVAVGKGTLFPPEQETIAKALADSICAFRSEISRNVARAQLAGEVLPSLYTFDVAVDMRLRVVDGEVKLAVPVAVLHIDTDVAHVELWLQMSKADLEGTIKKLSNALDEMKLAETLALRKS